MMVYAINDTKKREQELRLLIFKLPKIGIGHKLAKAWPQGLHHCNKLTLILTIYGGLGCSFPPQ